jgi:putative methanogenesis marker protein 1
MRLTSRPKVKDDDGQRSVAAEETLGRIENLIKVAGITRVADITRLDRIGIPVFSSIRPEAETGAISVYNGKGLTKVQAKVSAIMEGLERYSAEVRGDEVVRKLLRQANDALDPRELILPRQVLNALASRPVGFVGCYDIANEKEVMVPCSAVFHPYNSERDIMLFRSNTNGLASGNNLEEAVLHGLCEVVERDSWSLCEARRSVVADMDLTGCGRKLAKCVEMFESKGIELHFKDMTSDVGLPVIGVAADDVASKDPGLLTLGIGAHPVPEVAALKGLVEVAQSRLTQIHGAREDTTRAGASRQLGYERMKELNRMWFQPSGTLRSLEGMRDISTTDIRDDIMVVIEGLRNVGLRKVIVHDLTRKELGVPVVRVIVPGLEVYALDPDRVGSRFMEAAQP